MQNTTWELKMYNLTMDSECFWDEMRANMNVWLMFCILLRWIFYESQSSSSNKNNIFNTYEFSENLIISAAVHFAKDSFWKRRIRRKKKPPNQSTVLSTFLYFHCIRCRFTYRSDNVNLINRGRTEFWRWYEYI